jgi:hypothetical protein
MGKAAAGSESIMAMLEGTSELVSRTSGSAAMPLPLPLFRPVGALAGEQRADHSGCRAGRAEPPEPRKLPALSFVWTRGLCMHNSSKSLMQ